MSEKDAPRRIGSFAVEEELSVDELGAWYRARDERLDRSVALRVWRLRGQRAELRPLIRARARAAAALSHPNLPTVFGREEIGATDLLSVEFIQGETLADLIRAGHRWRPLDAARLMLPVVDALAVAHAADLAHGAIALERIRLTADGRPVLLGLGVARTTAEAMAPVGDADAMREDVRALARVIGLLAGGAPERGRTVVDPMLAVESSLLEPVLLEASRERSKRLPDAAALREGLVAVTTPGAAHRRTPLPPPAAAPPPRPRVDEPAAGAGPGFQPSARPRRTLPESAAGNMSVLLPVDREQQRSGGGAGRRIAAGLALGALLAYAGLRAWDAGLLTPARYLGGDSTALAAGDEQFAVAAPRESAAAPDFSDSGSAPNRSATAPDTALAVAPAPELVPAVPPPPPPQPPPQPEQRTPRPTPTRTATISVSPPDAMISRVADGEYVGMGSAVLSVPQGDSLRLQLNRQGYVAEQRVFRGDPLSVTLRPDSVQVRFTANVPVEVVIDTEGGQRVLGTTNLEARLPTGEYRVRFRSPQHEEWSVLADFPRAGSSYRVSKLDYATRGSVVIAVQGGWARVSLNGGPERETPARFDDLPDARHIVRLSRDGFETIVDTIAIAPGQVTTRQYRMRPVR